MPLGLHQTDPISSEYARAGRELRWGGWASATSRRLTRDGNKRQIIQTIRLVA